MDFLYIFPHDHVYLYFYWQKFDIKYLKSSELLVF